MTQIRYLISLCFSLVVLTSFSQTTVYSLQELKTYLDQDNVNIKLEPGEYHITGEDCENGLFGDDIEIGNPEKVMLHFSGSNSTYDFTGVTIFFETAIFQTFGGGYDMAEVHVTGNFNVLKNLTMVDDGSVYDKPDKGGNGIVMDGEGNLIEGFHQTTKGSFPYGYGDVFGKGGSYTIKHFKHCSTLIRGQSNQFKNNTIIHRSYGHALYMQAAFDPVIDGCYIEGEMRSTDDMLLEEGTGSPADLIDFQTDFGFRLLPGWTKALGEEGIRAYNGGTTVVNGDTLTGAAANPTVTNCTVKNMRGGVTLAHANGTAYVENCRTIGCQGGYSIRTGSVVDCYADAAYGQVLKYAYDNYSNTNIEITIIPPEDGYYHNGTKCAAYIGGNNHNIVLRSADPNPNPELSIQLGGHIDFLSFQEGNEVSSQNNHTPSGVSLENYTGYNIIVAEGSDNNDIQTCGTWEDNGAGNTITTFTDCTPTTSCLPVRDPFAKVEAVSFCETVGAGIAGGGSCIGSIFNGDWVLYSDAVFGSDIADGIEITVGKAHEDVTFIDVYLDDLNTDPIASVEVPFTGGWYDWQTVSVDLPEVTGVHDILFGFRNDVSGEAVANVESFSFLQNDLCGLTELHGLTPIEAEDYCEMSGVEIEENTPGSWVLTAIEEGDYAAYGNVDFDEETVNSIVANASSVTDGGIIEVRDGSVSGTLITTIEIGNTGSFDTYEDFTPEYPFSLTGKHDIYLVFKGNSFYLDVFEFEFNECKETSFDGFTTIQAEDFCKYYGIGTETVSGNNLAVNAIQNNDYIAFGNVDFASGSASKLTIRTASQTDGGTLEVRSGGIYGELITTVEIGGTGNWKTYAEYETTVPFTLTGKHDLYLVFKVESGYICNIDEFTFSGDPCEVVSNDGMEPIEAEDYCDMSGVQTETIAGDNLAVNHIQAGDYIAFGNVDFGGAVVNTFYALASSQTTGGTLEVRTGSETGELITTLALTGTGNWGNYQEFVTTEPFELSGVQDIYLVFTDADGYICNIDNFGFIEDSGPITFSTDLTGSVPSVSPNPSTGIFTLHAAGKYSILNSLGEEVLQGAGQTIDLSAYPAGAYFLRVEGTVISLIKE